MQEIESNQFSARLNVASSFKVFIHTALKESVFKELILELTKSRYNIWLVLQRATELAQKEFDSRYENPWDTALTIYLEALSLVKPKVAETAASFILRSPNCWWATRLAKSVLNKKKTTIPSNVVKIDVDTGQQPIAARPISNPQRKASLPPYSLNKSSTSGLTMVTKSARRTNKSSQVVANFPVNVA